MSIVPQILGSTGSTCGHHTLISPDSRWIIVLRADEGRLYVFQCPTGNLHCSLPLNARNNSETSSNNWDCVLFNPVNSEQEVLCFAERGAVLRWNYVLGGEPVYLGLLDLRPPKKDATTISTTLLGVWWITTHDKHGGRAFCLVEGPIQQEAEDANSTKRKSRSKHDCCLYSMKLDLSVIGSIGSNPQKRLSDASSGSAIVGSLQNFIFSGLKADPANVVFHFSEESAFVAAIVKSELRLFFFREKLYQTHSTGRRTQLTCVAVHPTLPELATGLSSGRIFLWHELINNASSRPKKTELHWHAAPVGRLLFSPEGSCLWSGGVESTLVQWSLVEQSHNDFLPRLSGPIVGLSTSLNHSQNVIAVTHENASITIVGLQRNILGHIDNLSFPAGFSGECQSDGRLLPLVEYDPYHNYTVIRGQPGQLRFSDAKGRKVMFKIDVVGENVLSGGAKDWKLTNTEVDCAAFSHGTSTDEQWMATADSLVTKHIGVTTHLRFWSLTTDTETYTAHSVMLDPHDGHIIKFIVFSPVIRAAVDDADDLGERTRGTSTLSAVSLADDAVKLWRLIPADRINGRKWMWICEGTARSENIPIGRPEEDSKEPQDLRPVTAVFSADALNLAIAFNQYITLWKVRNFMERKNQMLKNPENEIVRAMSFMERPDSASSSCLTAVHESSVVVWDLISSTEKFVVRMDKFSVCCARFDVSVEIIWLCVENLRLWTVGPREQEANVPTAASLAVEGELTNKTKAYDELMTALVVTNKEREESEKLPETQSGSWMAVLHQIADSPAHTVAPMKVLIPSLLSKLLCGDKAETANPSLDEDIVDEPMDVDKDSDDELDNLAAKNRNDSSCSGIPIVQEESDKTASLEDDPLDSDVHKEKDFSFLKTTVSALGSLSSAVSNIESSKIVMELYQQFCAV